MASLVEFVKLVEVVEVVVVVVVDFVVVIGVFVVAVLLGQSEAHSRSGTRRARPSSAARVQPSPACTVGNACPFGEDGPRNCGRECDRSARASACGEALGKVQGRHCRGV